MTLEWDPNKVPGQALSLEDYELFTSAAMTTSLLKGVLPYKRGAMELINMEKSYDCYHVPLCYWFYFSAADLESLPVDEKFCHLLKARVDDAYVVLLLGLLNHFVVS
jgi:hypothetical protein